MSHLTETVIDEEAEISYEVSATWGFLERLKRNHRSLNDVYTSLMGGELNPDYIKNVISSSLESVNSEEVNDAKRQAVAVEIIEKFGLQEASILARDMISRAMVGKLKLAQIERNQTTTSLMNQLCQSSKSRPSWKALSLWVAVAMTSGALGCLIFNYIIPLTLKSME